MLKVIAGQAATDPNEVAALNKMVDYWNLRPKLNFTVDPCTQNATWAQESANPRIACDCSASVCHVTHLKLYALDISGEIPKELFMLKELMDLSLGINNLTGPVPAELGNLTELISLSFSSNNFDGSLPRDLGKLTSLQQLRFQGTALEGPIPSSFSALTKLEDLLLRNCLVAGQLPTQLSGFTNLQILYLGSNNLSGELPANIVTPKLVALDISFNSISGNLPLDSAKVGFSMNTVGTSINANSLLDVKASTMLHCLQGSTKCSNKVPASSFSIKCGGNEQVSAAGINFNDDSETLGAASMHASSNYQWAVSNTGSFISNPNGPRYIAQIDSQITGTLESEVYKTARISPSSLRYYGLGLKNRMYNIELHFAEIQMEDSHSWKGLGKRLFDIYIQGEKVIQDFSIRNEAGGSKRALVKRFKANVTNTVMDIHFFWAGRGTCCIPFQSTYGPLVSAIHVQQGFLKCSHVHAVSSSIF
ncbi:hypothetical protein RJ639_001933 [Escallonia herrerae]|uniref:non-specific serine/threonine protein kinase n=1 Tax=Escallonia herrerae TaxID=1293975 RepID=A0AA88XBW1_9ASTE|nr:hypothetical protein RJ639_001933 [Escallonia herrerae]